MLEGEAPTQIKTNSVTQVFKRRGKGIVIKDSAVEKELASELAKANQIIASQRQEITALSIKAHQDAVSIITKEILVHLSSPEKKQKLEAKKERTVKINQEQSLQVEAAIEAKKKAIQDEEEKRRLELERKQKEELDAKRRAEIEHKKQKEEEIKERLRKEKEKEKKLKEKLKKRGEPNFKKTKKKK